jgi:hypothetical protein
MRTRHLGLPQVRESSVKINGWTILFHPLFNDQWQQLLDLVKSLRSRLLQQDMAIAWKR